MCSLNQRFTIQTDFYQKIASVDIHTRIFHSVRGQETVSLMKLCFWTIFIHFSIFFEFKGIGQKFALLEEKSVISAVLRNYKIEAIDRREDLTLLGELILRPKDGLRVKITKRQ